jgi:hypothetical protein
VYVHRGSISHLSGLVQSRRKKNKGQKKKIMCFFYKSSITMKYRQRSASCQAYYAIQQHYSGQTRL